MEISMRDRVAVDSRHTLAVAAEAEGTAAAAAAAAASENNQACAAEDARGHNCRTHVIYTHTI